MVPRRVLPTQDSSGSKSLPGILVVDDEPAVLSFLQKGLSQSGFNVWLAPDGTRAVELYKTHRNSISAVLMDIRMAGLDGPSTLRALRSIDSNIRCCFMSGGSGEYSKEELLSTGATYVIPKPFALSEVIQVLGQMVSEYPARVA